MKGIAIPLVLSLVLATPTYAEDLSSNHPAYQQQAQPSDQEVNCLALNIYYEARGAGEVDQRAVADVTLNRLHSGLFGSSICAVVYQRMQFSWTNSGRQHQPQDQTAWDRAQRIAAEEIARYTLVDGYDITMGAMYFYAHRLVHPRWAHRMVVTLRSPTGHTYLRLNIHD